MHSGLSFVMQGPNGSFLCFLEFKKLLLEVELQLARYQQAQVAVQKANRSLSWKNSNVPSCTLKVTGNRIE